MPLSPDIKARVRELIDKGVHEGDAIGQARYELDHKDDPPPWPVDDDEEYQR